MKAKYLLTSLLEPTNEANAMAKVVGIEMCQAYRKQHGADAMRLTPTNLYGLKNNSKRKSLTLFRRSRVSSTEPMCGALLESLSGGIKPRREFMHVDDTANVLYCQGWKTSCQGLRPTGF